MTTTDPLAPADTVALPADLADDLAELDAELDAGLDAGWVAVCPLDRLTPDRGMAALVDGRAVALFRLSTGALFAVGNVDPCSGASVLSRGLVGDADGTPTVASPLYKQRFDLRTGRCLDDPDAVVPVHGVRVVDGVVELRRTEP